MELRSDLSVFGLGDDFLVFSEEAQRLAILNHSAGLIVRRLMAGARPDEIAQEFVSNGLAAADAAPHWVADIIETLRTNRLTAGSSPGEEQRSSEPNPNTKPDPEALPPPPTYRIVAEKTYRLLGTRALVRFGLKDQVGWVDAALEHLSRGIEGPPDVIFDIPGEELPNGRRFATVYRDGQCLQANVRLFCIGPIVKSALWQSAVNAHDFLFNFHAGVVGHQGSCILLPGAAGSGKSSLTAALTHSGFEYFSDEVALIEPHTFKVPRVPLALCVKSTGWDAIAEYYPRILHLPTHRRADGKLVRYLRAIAVDAAHRLRSAPVRHIIFPRYEKDKVTEIRAIPRGEALERLTSECVAVRRRLTRDDAERLARWMAGIDCYALSFSSLGAAVGLVRQVVVD